MIPAAEPMCCQSSSGLLLHLTSLPGPDDSEDLSEVAFQFIVWASANSIPIWIEFGGHHGRRARPRPFGSRRPCSDGPAENAIRQLVLACSAVTVFNNHAAYAAR